MKIDAFEALCSVGWKVKHAGLAGRANVLHEVVLGGMLSLSEGRVATICLERHFDGFNINVYVRGNAYFTHRWLIRTLRVAR